MNKYSEIQRAGRSFGPAVKSIKTTAALLLCSAAAFAAHADDNRAPEVPPQIAVSSETNKIHFHGFGVGFQVYTWNGTSWGSAVPDALLFNGEAAVVATHFAGPSWQSKSGSLVVGALPPDGAIIMDTNSIPWLRLRALVAEGPGIFANTTYIQRVNTTGGKAPSTPGAFIGQVARVPYTADYFFYRAANDND
jgi:hypothetical protein